ncbi:MAG: FUSC family protein, partial [Brevundimonas sp.]|nr:FUSC family protein [Brevundimonas sp.]
MARALSPRRAAEVRSALQMAVGAVVAFYLATAFKLPHPYWSVISAIVVIQASVGGGVLTVARDRAVGTLVGALIGGAAAFLRPEGVNWMMATLAACTAGLAFFATGRPWLKVAPVTAAIVIAGAAGPEGPAQLALDRVLEILVHPDNAPSRRVAARAGFADTGALRAHRRSADLLEVHGGDDVEGVLGGHEIPDYTRSRLVFPADAGRRRELPLARQPLVVLDHEPGQIPFAVVVGDLGQALGRRVD